MRNARFKPRRSHRGVGFAQGGDTFRLESAAGRGVGQESYQNRDAAAAAARDAARSRKRRFIGEVSKG